MARRFETAKRFKIKVSRTYNYVLENWGVIPANNFLEKLKLRFGQIEKHPGIGRPSGKKPKIRRILVGKQNILYYSSKRSKTSIHNMFSPYADPDKNPYG